MLEAVEGDSKDMLATHVPDFMLVPFDVMSAVRAMKAIAHNLPELKSHEFHNFQVVYTCRYEPRTTTSVDTFPIALILCWNWETVQTKRNAP